MHCRISNLCLYGSRTKILLLSSLVYYSGKSNEQSVYHTLAFHELNTESVTDLLAAMRSKVNCFYHR